MLNYKNCNIADFINSVTIFCSLIPRLILLLGQQLTDFVLLHIIIIIIIIISYMVNKWYASVFPEEEKVI
jgi:hypothetical protein